MGDTQNVYFSINPEQIKLADGTNSTFDSNNPDIRFEDGGEITNYTEFFDNLEIEDGSIYIGQKFGDVFPFLKRRGARPNTYRNMVNQYYGILDRLRKDNFSSPIQKKRDLNKLERKRYIEKKKYLAKFYLDGIGTIVDFRASNYDDKNDNIDFEKGGELKKDIECYNCGWEWNKKDSEKFDMYVCHNCGFDNSSLYKSGGEISKTPAPKSEQIYGSKVNKQDSSSDIKEAKNIKFDEKTLLTINDKVKEHNKKYPNKKINLASAKAVVRRGMGAYSSSHRPTITGGKPNSRVAWGLARLNAFIYKIIIGKS
jgi:hypothetical protein